MLVCSAASDTLGPLGPCVASGKDTSGLQARVNFVTPPDAKHGLVTSYRSPEALYQEHTKASPKGSFPSGAVNELSLSLKREAMAKADNEV